MIRARTVAPVLVFALVTATAAGAGELEDALRASWVETWVTIKSEVRSDCLDCYTENRVSGGAVSGKGGRLFAAGELGQVAALDVHRERVDLAIELTEPLLVNVPHGRFVLAEERRCWLELQVEIERQEMKEKSVSLVELRLGELLDRFPTLAEARASTSWNGRTTDPLPPDHEARLREVREWQAGWEERARPAALDAIRKTMPRHTDFEYLDGFSRGLDYAEDLEWGGCAELSQLPLPSAPASAGEPGATEAEARTRGWSDGIAFVTALRMLESMARCRTPPTGEDE